jgi:hypothetical protein
MHPPTSRSSQWSLTFWLSHQYHCCIPLLSHSCYMPCPSHPPWLDPLGLYTYWYYVQSINNFVNDLSCLCLNYVTWGGVSMLMLWCWQRKEQPAADTCFMLVSWMTYFSALKMEAVCFSKMWADFHCTALHCTVLYPRIQKLFSLYTSHTSLSIKLIFFISIPLTSIPYFYGVEVFHFSLDLYTIGRTPWTSDRPVTRPLPKYRATQTQHRRARAHTHTHTHTHTKQPYPKWDSNPRSQRPHERRQFMP